jgi:hypothetical protein
MWELSQNLKGVRARCQTDEAEVSVACYVFCVDSCLRPTHDQIEQLQSKVNELEDLLRAATGGELANTAEAWRQNGSTNAEASSSRRLTPNASIDEPAHEEGNDDTGAAFDTPPGDQYIYDTTGYVDHQNSTLMSVVSSLTVLRLPCSRVMTMAMYRVLLYNCPNPA